MIIKNLILKTFILKDKKGWDQLYWAIDVHETCIVPNYKANEICREFYPIAKEALQRISKRKDSTLILFTCAHPHEIEQYLEYFKEHDIHFKYTNHNLEAENTAYGCFEKKFYCNFLFDDKAGFDADIHWEEVMDALDVIDLRDASLPDYKGYADNVAEFDRLNLPYDIIALSKKYNIPHDIVMAAKKYHLSL